jgi:hypothetical protein
MPQSGLWRKTVEAGAAKLGPQIVALQKRPRAPSPLAGERCFSRAAQIHSPCDFQTATLPPQRASIRPTTTIRDLEPERAHK